MEIKIHNPAIVYLALSLFMLFIGIKQITKKEVMLEIIIILFITFVLNVLCINGLNNVAWYFVIFFILLPIFLAIISILPLFIAMLRTKIFKFKTNKQIILFLLFLLGLSIFIVFYILYFSWISQDKSRIYTFSLFLSSLLSLILIFIGAIYIANTK